ncbi:MULTISPECIES: hypothetical protein [Flavobacteriaceae]|uniref:hypothetical protein n=1 Tax=Flavobacteriaceae TaxID=49546 RepID=UPI001491C125|nr:MULTISPECIES: hypothetical protein [Allomuricauda]MDC6365181.1 hypothetical protein [Muricauda sp. AC10]
MKSNFLSDLAKEKQLSQLLDVYYNKHLKCYDFDRISSLKEQNLGIDIVLKHKNSKAIYFVDEKAQLDYINESLPTFAFELFYEKKGVQKQGWLFDDTKKTHFYALVTSIFSDVVHDEFTSCNITLVNRQKLIQHLASLGLTKTFFAALVEKRKDVHGKLELEKLSCRNEGYLYFSTKNKAEKPINLILRLNYLIEIGVAKRLV